MFIFPFQIGEMARIVKDGLVGKPIRDPYTGELGHQALPMTDVTKDVSLFT
jgi:hypothetical protein